MKFLAVIALLDHNILEVLSLLRARHVLLATKKQQNKVKAAKPDESAKRQSMNEFLIIPDDELEYDSHFTPVSGNLGDVRKAIWHGIPVAVKTLRRKSVSYVHRFFHRYFHRPCHDASVKKYVG